jgi:hypothetical protein
MRHVKNPRREGKYLEAFDRALSWARLGSEWAASTFFHQMKRNP